MAGDDASLQPPPPLTAKAYAVTNIKTYVPLILDLATHNYDPWRDLFTAHCIAFEVLDHIDTTYDAPKSAPEDPQWQKLDQLVKLWLFGSISQSLITSVYTVNATARRIWLNIEARFRQNNDSTAMQLESELRSITQGDMSVDAYFDRIKKISDLLEGIGEKVKEKHIVIHAINGLSSKYESTAGFIRHTKPLPSFDEARSMILVEEQRLKNHSIPTPSHEQHSSSPQLLNVNRPTHNPSQRGGGGNPYRRNSRGNGNHHQSNRRRAPPSEHPPTTGNPVSHQRFGWIYVPPKFIN